MTALKDMCQARRTTITVNRTAPRKAKRRLWADKNPVPPWIYRKLKRGEKLGQSDNLPYVSIVLAGRLPTDDVCMDRI